MYLAIVLTAVAWISWVVSINYSNKDFNIRNLRVKFVSHLVSMLAVAILASLCLSNALSVDHSIFVSFAGYVIVLGYLGVRLNGIMNQFDELESKPII